MRLSQSLTIHVPGKLLLFGEHAAVFGYPAVGTALSRGLDVTCRPAARLSLEIPGAGVSETEIARFVEHIEAVAAASSTAAGSAASVPAEALTMTAELPLSSGFGSSAALCTGIARRMLAAAGTAAEGTAVWHLAHELERFFHGTPSGIDTGLTSLGGTRSFHFDPTRPGTLPETRPVVLPDIVLVAGAVPRTTTTKELVAGVRERRNAAPARYDALLRRLGELSTAATDADLTDINRFAALATEAHRVLGELGVSSDVLDGILAVGQDAGALGGKLSGAGGGGAFYCVCRDLDGAEKVRRAIKKSLPEGGTVFIHSASQFRDQDQTGQTTEGP